MEKRVSILAALLMLVPAIASANVWSNLNVCAGSKLASAGTRSGFVYGLGLDLVSRSGLGLAASYTLGSIEPAAGGAAQHSSSGALLLQYYLNPGRASTPYVGYGINYGNYAGTTAQGTRGVVGLLMKMEGDMAIKFEGAYDQLDNVGGVNLTGWTGSAGIVFNLAGPKDHGPEHPEMHGRPGDNPPPPGSGPRRPGDRDRDGVPNRYDDRPNNPYRN